MQNFGGGITLVCTSRIWAGSTCRKGMTSAMIRQAELGDASKILELYEELEDVHRSHHPQLYRSTPGFHDQAWVEAALQDPHVGILVADGTADGSPALSGFVRIVDVQTPEGRVLIPRRFGLVEDLVVAQAYRRNGVATDLLRAAETWAMSRGLPALEVTVWAFNRGAQNLYEKNGFSVLRHYFRKQLTASGSDDADAG
jgi:ribosomal protein S18 acetylase RimI-like enzyme